MGEQALPAMSVEELWTRAADRSWRHERIMGLDAHVALASIDVTLHLADLYEGLTFPHRPQIVPD